ncbi:Phenylalanyl-tRNA synthetase alpha chain [Mycoplasmopsis meleagridis]|uniref:phenylalanine--tRNA ligase n=1 Tax=Mycoplasmopsis meleagridis ATCC 25294 TaxID=1264554 RepID=A0A0F5H0I8_9BACT|nr:phenylalanine--tRNA ligase subunit alpha [Mycoplasmopsis meleagridis]KKB26640.1 Phenylalanyl-tRNA synthetase alpha chain [Mycoplasmopsis meleagridis ATCC 25294]OAD18245.1 Phenylalanyl-tRNA synthetase alpha chain [Mycoplasmopsis meleagridis]VEU77694.1 phenylalanyl-tRNA synthetase subunit alpha [Mycoplasmopsis meleagridis]
MHIEWDKINTLEDLKKAKNKIYSKDGELFKLKQEIKNSSIERKKIIGQKLSELNEKYEKLIKLAEENIEIKRIENLINKEKLDVSFPVNRAGSLHPITIIENRLRDWFMQNSYFEAKAGELEWDRFNFERLNIQKDHPARDMQDSLYVDDELLLRTHNTGISALILDKNKNKEINTFSIGKVYRNDEDDLTHSHQFTQLDFVSVGKVSFPNLIWTLKSLLSYVFETEIELRLRPSYFPFTEPSVEVDIYYNNRWIEVLGAGMLHPNVLKMAGYDTNIFNGFAAGIGLERLAMIKYGIKDIREFYRNDLRTLNQFKNEK